jgi:hypothetical protein
MSSLKVLGLYSVSAFPSLLLVNIDAWNIPESHVLQIKSCWDIAHLDWKQENKIYLVKLLYFLWRLQKDDRWVSH